MDDYRIEFRPPLPKKLPAEGPGSRAAIEEHLRTALALRTIRPGSVVYARLKKVNPDGFLDFKIHADFLD